MRDLDNVISKTDDWLKTQACDTVRLNAINVTDDNVI